MPDRYAVIGNPVSHSKSPLIHAAFARDTGEDLVYEALLAPMDGFAVTVRQFMAEGGRGANVTVPFKQEAYRLASRRSARAEAAKAANLLAFDGEEIFADNTDGVGLVTDLQINLGFGISARRVLLLGAGGAARGCLLPLLSAGPAALVVANRHPEKASQLAAEFAALTCGVPLEGRGFDALAGERFDLIINATAASLSDEAPRLPPGVYGEGSLAYDMMYGKGETPFLREARAGGAARVADGLGMLLEQAAESFLIWRGVRPATARLLAELREK